MVTVLVKQLLCVALLSTLGEATRIVNIKSSPVHQSRWLASSPHKAISTVPPVPTGGEAYTVKRIKNPDYIRNGPAAKEQVFSKYGWDSGATPSQTFARKTASGVSQPTALGKRQGQVGTAQAIPQQYYSEYLCQVEIGGQTLMIDFDSGSSDFWIFSKDLPANETINHTLYDSTESSTFTDLPGYNFSIQYGDGSAASGVVGLDKVVIGGATVTQQAIEMATSVTQNFVDDTGVGGVMGLGFSNINNVYPVQQLTVFDNLISTLASPVFSVDMREDNSSFFSFGSVPTTSYTDSLTALPNFPGNGYWEFLSPFYAINGTLAYNLGCSPAIADTGTSLLIVDQAVADAFYAQIYLPGPDPGSTDGALQAGYDDDQGAYIFPCQADIPTFGVSVGDRMVTVPKEYINYANLDSDGTWCYGGVQDNGGFGLQIFGDVFFRSTFVVFENSTGGSASSGFLGLRFGDKAVF